MIGTVKSLWRFRTLLVSFLLVWFLIISNAAADPAANSGLLQYDPVKKILSVNLRNVTVADFASRLAAETKIRVMYDDSIEVRLTAKFDNMPLELGIKRVLGPVSSSFIFVEEKAAGEISYRLRTVKIFQRGKMLAAKYTEVGGGDDVGSNIVMLDNPASIRQAIIMGQQNLDLIRQKNSAEVDRLERQIAELNRALSMNPAMEARAQLVKSLAEKKHDKVKVENLNWSLIREEERNLRDLAERALKENPTRNSQKIQADQRINERRDQVKNSHAGYVRH